MTALTKILPGTGRGTSAAGGGGPRRRPANSVGPLHHAPRIKSGGRGSPPRAGRICHDRPFPTRKQEEWRYADLDALQPVWEQFAEPVTLTVGPGESFEEVWLPTSDDVQVRRVQIALGGETQRRGCSCSTPRRSTDASS